jgi:endonuclease YncB( thermonuclease family)
MSISSFPSQLRHARWPLVLAILLLFERLPAIESARAAGCALAPQGEGHVVEIIDERSFRLADGREIRMAGIEPALPEADANSRTAALAAILAGRDVTLRGTDDTPDRYGRQTAFVFLASSETQPSKTQPSETLVQSLLLAQGAALASADIADKECEGILMGAEAEARQAKKGAWNGSTAMKKAEIPDDILAAIGRFAVVEGKVLSVRQAGATTYLNFGRNWTRDFAATISRRAMPAIEAGGIVLKSLENRQIRVRGFIEARPGPRIELLRAAQIEVLSDN